MNAELDFWVLLLTLLGLVLLCVKPLGTYMANVLDGKPTLVTRAGSRFEEWIYRGCGIAANEDMGWPQYAIALLLFNVLGALVVYAIAAPAVLVATQPANFGGVCAPIRPSTPPSASSPTRTGRATRANRQWVTSCRWPGWRYRISCPRPPGIGVAIALVRGFARHTASAIGNFWVDVTRSTLYVLLPLAAVLAIALVSHRGDPEFRRLQGRNNNRADYLSAAEERCGRQSRQGRCRQSGHGNRSPHRRRLPMGPVASQESIKELGTNGGGFFNANSAHPYENPTAMSNLLEMLAILVIPFALTYTFGRMVGDTRQGWVLLAAMLVLLVPLIAAGYYSEQRGNPLIARQGSTRSPAPLKPAATWKARKRALASRPRACLRRSPPRPRAARSTRCTTR